MFRPCRDLGRLSGIVGSLSAPALGKLDPALLHRPSRFDRIWKFPLPRYDQRLALLGKLATGRFSHETLQKVARQSDGFSMAYIQEIVVNAVLQHVDQGGVPDDVALLKSVEVLRSQRKSAAKVEDDVAEHDRVGFCSPA